jgi:hypothetical protein
MRASRMWSVEINALPQQDHGPSSAMVCADLHLQLVLQSRSFGAWAGCRRIDLDGRLIILGSVSRGRFSVCALCLFKRPLYAH